MSEQVSKARINARRALALGGIGLAALGARDVIRTGVKTGNDVANFVGSINVGTVDPNAAGHVDTQKDLAKLPDRTVIIAPGEGVDTAIAKVDGKAGIFSNGQELESVRKFIDDQSPTGVVQPGPVQVPVLPKGK